MHLLADMDAKGRDVKAYHVITDSSEPPDTHEDKINWVLRDVASKARVITGIHHSCAARDQGPRSLFSTLILTAEENET